MKPVSQLTKRDVQKLRRKGYGTNGKSITVTYQEVKDMQNFLEYREAIRADHAIVGAIKDTRQSDLLVDRLVAAVFGSLIIQLHAFNWCV